jgi:phosphatidylethanolamine-binding protein (PEBP) family uncharacterized protein
MVARIPFKSAAMKESSIPVKYTCEGSNTPPTVEWGPVPASTASLTLLVVGVTPEPATQTDALSVEWAVAGIPPALHKLVAGKLPPGVRVGVGTHGKRYSICPPKGKQVQYVFEIYGLPATEAVAPDFQGLQVLKELNSSSRLGGPNARGSFTVSFERI